MRETGQRLKAYAKHKGIVLRWIADKMDITSVTLYYKVSGKSPITLEDGIRIRNLCRMSKEDFNAVFNKEEWFPLVGS